MPKKEVCRKYIYIKKKNLWAGVQVYSTTTIPNSLHLVGGGVGGQNKLVFGLNYITKQKEKNRGWVLILFKITRWIQRLKIYMYFKFKSIHSIKKYYWLKSFQENICNHKLLNFREISFIAVNKNSKTTLILCMQQQWSYLRTKEVVKYYISIHLDIKKIVFHFFVIKYTLTTLLCVSDTQILIYSTYSEHWWLHQSLRSSYPPKSDDQ